VGSFPLTGVASIDEFLKMKDFAREFAVFLKA
jgi:hypothetical protein